MGCEGYSWCICDIESGLSVCLRAVKLEYPQQQVSEVRSSYNQFRLCTLAGMKLPTEKLTVCFSYKENDRKQKIKKTCFSEAEKCTFTMIQDYNTKTPIPTFDSNPYHLTTAKPNFAAAIWYTKLNCCTLYERENLIQTQNKQQVDYCGG